MGDAAALDPLTGLAAFHAHWRNNNHQFDEIPSSVQGYVRDQLRIPAVHSAILLPNPRISVLDFISTSVPPISKSEAHYPIPDGHDFFSSETGDPDIELLSTTLVPPRSLIIQLLPQAKQKWLDGAESIRIPDEKTLLPLWSLQFWSDIHLTNEPARVVWQSAINWLTSLDLSLHPIEVCATLDALSTLSWSGCISAVRLSTSALMSYPDPYSWVFYHPKLVPRSIRVWVNGYLKPKGPKARGVVVTTSSSMNPRPVRRTGVRVPPRAKTAHYHTGVLVGMAAWDHARMSPTLLPELGLRPRSGSVHKRISSLVGVRKIPGF
ncbi:hypothetical protein FPV67DRAFT_1452907 [Lyophyllum atratum]|nr:hypothetical protein FPV67DRAFT_1452907 [Lyophyllum atratum]